MIYKLLKKIKNMFTYVDDDTLEAYIIKGQPQSVCDVEILEREFRRIQSRKADVYAYNCFYNSGMHK